MLSHKNLAENEMAVYSITSLIKIRATTILVKTKTGKKTDTDDEYSCVHRSMMVFRKMG